MPGTTTELGLSTAVDSDDNADYLTISLANSLRTIDALYNNVTGHVHSGAHQGGPIAPAAIADGSITNAKLGPDVARANLLVNPGFEIWQRGNGAFTANNAFTADLWRTSLAGTDTLSVSKDTTNVDVGSGACAACAFVLGSGAGSTLLYQGNLADFAPLLAGRTITFTIRVRCSVTSAVRAAINDTIGNFSSLNTTSGAYETLVVTRTVPAGVGGLQFGVYFSKSCTVYIDSACVVVGSAPAAYTPLHPADELARCQRYYEVLDDPGSGGLIVVGIAQASAQQAQATFSFNTKKVATPTITIVGTWTYVSASGLTIATASTMCSRVLVTATAAGPFLAYNNNAGNTITVEANS